ncbi:hypothetical protein YC2023_066017 [Brassica napus]
MWAVCSVHTGRLWVCVSTHRTSVCVRQHTQDVRGCPSVSFSTHRILSIIHTRRLWVSASTHRTSVAVRVCPCVFVCVLHHTQDVRGYPSVHNTLALPVVLGLSTLALPMDCLGDFGPRGLSVQYTGRPWVSSSTNMTSVAFCGCPSAHTGRLWLSVCVRVCIWVSASIHRIFVAVSGCLSAQTGRPCVSVSTHKTSVCVCQHTQDVRGCPSVHISAHWSLDSACWPFSWTVQVILAHVGCLFSTHRTSVGLRQHTQDVRGCPWLSVSTNRTSECVRQHTQDVRVCLSSHTGRPWLSISTHISTLVLGLRTLALPVDGSGDFGPRGLSVQYTQDGRGCPSAHTGRPCLSISSHISKLVLGLRMLALPVDCLGDFGLRGLSVQYTQDVRGCPPAHT